jgi:hypothetical protein
VATCLSLPPYDWHLIQPTRRAGTTIRSSLTSAPSLSNRASRRPTSMWVAHTRCFQTTLAHMGCSGSTRRGARYCCAPRTTSAGLRASSAMAGPRTPTARWRRYYTSLAITTRRRCARADAASNATLPPAHPTCARLSPSQRAYLAYLERAPKEGLKRRRRVSCARMREVLSQLVEQHVRLLQWVGGEATAEGCIGMPRVARQR